MFFRPGTAFGLNRFSLNPQYPDPKDVSFDEIWIEHDFADMDSDNLRTARDELASVNFTYWSDGRFLLSLSYAAADVKYVPSAVLSDSKEAPPLESCVYQKIKGEWFVLDSVQDRFWFESAVKELKN